MIQFNMNLFSNRKKEKGNYACVIVRIMWGEQQYLLTCAGKKHGKEYNESFLRK